MASYVYRVTVGGFYVYRFGDGCFTVGFYTPKGEWIPESDHETREQASDRVHWLNGGDKDGCHELASRNAGIQNGHMGNDH